MLKFSRGKLIVFDIDEALSFEGETGPYLQYAVVRANNILHKLQDRDGVVGGRRPRRARRARRRTSSPAESDDPSHDLWALVFEASRLDEVVESGRAIARVLGAGQVRIRAGADRSTRSTIGTRSSTKRRADRKRWRAAGVAYVRAQLTRALDLMGIDVPNRM